MQVNALLPQRRLDAATIPPEKLAANASLSEQEKLTAACRQFEAALLRQILEQAQKPMITSTLVKDSAAASIYRDVMTNQFANQISSSEALGLSRLFAQQLSRPQISSIMDEDQ